MDLISEQRRFIELREQKAALENHAKEIGKELEALTPLLAEEMGALGQSHTILDGKRFQVATKHRISKRGDVTMERICEVLSQHDSLGALVKLGVNSRSMESALREILEEEEELPAEIADLVRVYDQTLIYVTKE